MPDIFRDPRNMPRIARFEMRSPVDPVARLLRHRRRGKEARTQQTVAVNSPDDLPA